MDQHSFHQHIKGLRVGKSLPDALYLHKNALADASVELSNLCNRISQALKIPDQDWDLVKLFRKEFKVSFLSYPDFYTNSYPPLRKSIQVDLSKLSAKVTSYEESENPPILHRKELMVLPDDGHYQHFIALTKEGEAAGLYKNPFKIGFKATWERLIRESGYELVDGHIVQVPSAEPVDAMKDEIDRHLTAIIRYELSAPFKALAKFGFLDGDYSVFDYGCGRGDDLRELEAHGLSVAGWDPNFQPDADLEHADIVNLGFVINVIEDIDERIEAIQRAHSLSNTLTVISAMIAGESVISKFTPYRDGVLTSRNTFQKYFTQSELKFFIERTLDTEAIAAGPGIFFVFKDKLAEQRYLLNRTRRTHQWNHLRNMRISPSA
ncbi:MAG: DNA phosphorothioation-associated putative methyltransferase [Motiliproteus sp.]|nr:DNA phosphorothioation-associated putative methyltransferase [Motiliproteus sp.]MCW9052575.1 DNA phosphorothioation-associated putative methyltransferase [Motiliproteus sp.]